MSSKFDIFKFDDAREKEKTRSDSKFNLFKFEDKKPKIEPVKKSWNPFKK